jgi:hypothetical protein
MRVMEEGRFPTGPFFNTSERGAIIYKQARKHLAQTQRKKEKEENKIRTLNWPKQQELP